MALKIQESVFIGLAALSINVSDTINVQENVNATFPAVTLEVPATPSPTLRDSDGNTYSTDTITISLTPAGNNRAIYVGVIIRGDQSVSSVVFNTSENFSLIDSHDNGSTGTNRIATETWRLTNPTATTANVVVNLSAAPDSDAQAVAVALDNINQDSPIGAYEKTYVVSDTISDSITTLKKKSRVVDVCGVRLSQGTITGNQDEIYSNATGASTIASQETLAEDVEAYTFQWIFGSSAHLVLQTTEFKRSPSSVNDNLQITEDITAQLVEGIAPSDILEIQESITITPATLKINVSDTLEVSESIFELVKSFINVSDVLEISESVSSLVKSFVNVNDVLEISEQIDELLISFINVDDVLEILENISTTPATLTINVSDQIEIQENIIASSTGGITPSDVVEIQESITITPATLSINVSDDLEISELIQTIVISFVNIQDQIEIQELISITPATLTININDQINIAENIDALLVVENEINVSDEIQINESISAFIPKFFINVSDQLNISENIDASLVVEGVLTIDVSDQINISESISTQSSVITLSVSSVIELDETIEALVVSFIDLADQMSVSESSSVDPVKSTINVSDQINLNESVDGQLAGILSISVSDDIFIQDRIGTSTSSERIYVVGSESRGYEVLRESNFMTVQRSIEPFIPSGDTSTMRTSGGHAFWVRTSSPQDFEVTRIYKVQTETRTYHA